jgi:SAM-dependent methyltransferase
VPADVYDYAPPAFVRAAETFWSLYGPTFDRDQEGLELGSYRGEGLLRIAPFIGRMIGLETNAADHEEAARRTAGKPGLSARPWSGLAIPFPDASFDLVFVDFARPGFSPADPFVLWAEARRVLRPEGRLLVLSLRDGEEARALRDEWTDRLFETGQGPETLPALRREEDWRRDLESAGFAVSWESLGPALGLAIGTPPSPE